MCLICFVVLQSLIPFQLINKNYKGMNHEINN